MTSIFDIINLLSEKIFANLRPLALCALSLVQMNDAISLASHIDYAVCTFISSICLVFAASLIQKNQGDIMQHNAKDIITILYGFASMSLGVVFGLNIFLLTTDVPTVMNRVLVVLCIAGIVFYVGTRIEKWIIKYNTSELVIPD